jgi:hypothetical protein
VSTTPLAWPTHSGEFKHTAKYISWKLVSDHTFVDKRKAQKFEHYLKIDSGQAFASKRFW